MATLYVRSTDGSDSDDGSTWALAKASLAGAAAIDAAGDTIYISDAHSESTVGPVTFALAGTAASPTRVLCCDDAAEPPTALATSGQIATTSNGGITISGSAYLYGIIFQAGSGAQSITLQCLGSAGNETQKYEDCDFLMTATGSAAKIGVGNTGASAGIQRCEWINCDVRGAHSNFVINIGASWFEWNGGTWLSGGTSPTNMFSWGGSNRSPGQVIINGVDFSALNAGVNILNASGVSGPGVMILRNCKMPASWSGSLTSASIAQPGFRIEAHNVDAGDTNYRLWIEGYSGSVKSETTIVRSGGASDGTTALSWKMQTTANAEFPLNVLASPEIVVWSDTTGAKTVTVEIVHDGATDLNNDEVWLDVQYLGTSGFPLSLFADDCKADILASAAAQASSAETWTTTGLSDPNTQKLEVSITTAEKGPILARVMLAKASQTIYVCPKATVS